MADAQVQPVEKLLLPVKGEFLSRILVLIRGGAGPFVITPADKVTGSGHFGKGEGPLVCFDDIVGRLSDIREYVDLWGEINVDGTGDQRFFVRLFGRNVVTITQTFAFPDERDMVQS